jgi:carbon-monoxide dehydrogenase small subunit
MKPIRLIVNGRELTETVEPRTHLADLLRERLSLTGTHLRCEQGVCGACTLLIDGQPARSCITYAVLCEGAEITTIEGLEDDPIMTALRSAFTAEHGLQCGYCTPGMLVTARDIVTRLPDADEKRIRIELAGNLCRCTGYVGIVRAIRGVLRERAGATMNVGVAGRARIGPVGSGHAKPAIVPVAPRSELSEPSEDRPTSDSASVGLGARQPNIEMRQSFTVTRPQREVWDVLGQIERVVPCMPGATLTKVAGDHVEGRISIKLGPITSTFKGEARISRDEPRQCGVITGFGRDRLSGSRASADVEYALSSLHDGTSTRVDISIRALLSGPLAQFGRSGIVEDLAARLTQVFAQNLEQRLSGAAPADGEVEPPAPLRMGAMLRAMILARIRTALARWRPGPKP